MGDGDVHSYFSAFDSHYEAFRSFLEVLGDFKQRVKEELNEEV